MTNVAKSSRDGLETGSGRDEDTPNRSTRNLMNAVLLAAERVGEDGQGKDGLVGYCRFLARCEPKAFAQLRGRILPTQSTEIGDLVEVLTDEVKDAAVAATLQVDTCERNRTRGHDMAITRSLKTRLEKVEAREKPRRFRYFFLEETVDGFETQIDAIKASGAVIGENDLLWTITFQMRPDLRPDPVRYRVRDMRRSA